MATILVTGASGFIALHCIEQLLAQSRGAGHSTLYVSRARIKQRLEQLVVTQSIFLFMRLI